MTTATTTYLTDVLLLCTVCREPIKARINACNWLRVEWIGPSGECLKCYQESKNGSQRTSTTETTGE